MSSHFYVLFMPVVGSILIHSRFVFTERTIPLTAGSLGVLFIVLFKILRPGQAPGLRSTKTAMPCTSPTMELNSKVA
jgi:hypothetical protein